MSDWPKLPIKPADLPLIRQLMSEEEYRELLKTMTAGKVNDRTRDHQDSTARDNCYSSYRAIGADSMLRHVRRSDTFDWPRLWVMASVIRKEQKVPVKLPVRDFRKGR